MVDGANQMKEEKENLIIIRNGKTVCVVIPTTHKKKRLYTIVHFSFLSLVL
jgi:hypothetical protein